MPFFGVPIRNGLPIGLGSVAGFGAPQFDPSLLFEGGTVAGTWYDPSDLTTMFTTSAGTTPVAMPGQGLPAADSAVGLMLDKSQGLVLGSELVTNGDFSSGTTGWSAPGGQTLSVENGAGKALNASTGAYLGTSISVVTGTWYKFTYTAISDGTSKSVGFNLGSGIGTGTYISSVGGPYAFGTRSVYWCATVTGTVYPWFFAGSQTGSNYILIDNVSAQALPGNHAIAINDTTARPKLRARVNFLTYSEEFNQGVWSKSGVTVTANTSIAPNGTTTADTLTETTVNSYHSTYFINTVIAGQSVIGSVAIKKDSVRYAQINYGGTAAGRWIQCVVDLDTGLITQSSAGAGGTLVSSSSTSLGDGWYRVSLTGSVVTDTTTYFYVGTVSSATPSFNTFGVEERVGSTSNNVLIWGADLRPANIGANVPAYQRIADANTYDTAGFPLYLFFDGIDDGMYTPANLNLSATDKVGVFAGVRALQSAVQVISELSANTNSNNGSFVLYKNNDGLGFASRGTGLVDVNNGSGFAPPISLVLTGQSNITAPSLSLRSNGTQILSSTSSQGAGNFGTYPLYIGSRNNSSNWFNGHLYSLAVVGSAVSAGNIAAMENWVAGKTGIVIP